MVHRVKPKRAQAALEECDTLLMVGTSFPYCYARHIPIRRGQRCSLSGALASMANGLPYAIAAQVAHPNRQVVDPFEPPMPPKVPVDQAAKFGQSLLRGQSNREKIALTVMKDKVRELV